MHEIKQRIFGSNVLVEGNDLETNNKALMAASNFAGTEVKASKLLNGGRKLQCEPGTGAALVTLGSVARVSFA